MMPSSAKPQCRIFLRTIAVVIALLTVLAALVAAALAPYYLSAHAAQTSLLALTALVTFAAVVWLGMRFCAGLWRTSNPIRFATLTSGALTVVSIGALCVLVVRPTPLHFTEVKPAEGAVVRFCRQASDTAHDSSTAAEYFGFKS